MIRLGPAGTPHGVSSTKDSMKYLAEEGLNAMEVQFVRGARMKDSTAEKIGEEAKKYSIHLSIHAPYYINLNSEKDETIEKSKERIMKSSRLGDIMGAKIITVHAGYYSGMDSDEATEIIGDGVVECAEKITDENLNIKIGLEQMGRKKSWGTLDEIKKVMDRTEVAVPVVDFAHYHARYDGILQSENDFRELLEKFEDIYDGPLHSHFSSIEYNETGEREHMDLDAYDPDFRKLAPILKEKEYDITVICETAELDRDSLKMKEILGL
ncbi:MAG: TIM barrel protein [Candidatus Saliniplasma sp.]